MKYKITFFFLIISLFSFGQILSGVPTFSCVSLYGTGLTDGKIQYREAGSATWLNALDLWKDTRAIGGRPANEWRGSVVGLKPGTTYEFQSGSTILLTSTTWSETFPEASTTTLNSSTNITTSGTPTGYRVYTGKITGGNNNLVINASYVIIRNMTLTGAAEDAILLGNGVHDIVIEGCDISGWGYVGMGSNNQAAVRCKQGSNPFRIIIQRNKIHDSRDPGSGWDAEGRHPLGPNAITLDFSSGNHVIRYNTIYNTDITKKKFMDAIGGSDNFTYLGAPGKDSDIYGNSIDGVYDDAIEAEGGGMNVRVWGNWMNNTFTGVATATVSIGPMYVFRNISNVGQRLNDAGTSTATIDNEDRGPFNKNGVDGGFSQFKGGKLYLFHNTILEPMQSGFANARGLCGGPVDNGGSGGVTNVYSRNNIWQTFKTSRQSIGENQTGTTGGNSYDYDLVNGAVTVKQSSERGANIETGSPTYASSVGLTLNTAGYFLANGSKGKGNGLSLNNFNNGTNVDKGAYQTGEPNLEFGINAYLGTTPPPVNQPPSATASVDKPQITLPTNSVTLSGTGTDSDGTIILYAWSEVSGKTNYSLGSANSPTTTASNLIEGKYIFRLTVTDNKGATGFADVAVSVSPAPPDPTKVVPVYYDFIIHNSDSTVKTIRIKP